MRLIPHPPNLIAGSALLLGLLLPAGVSAAEVNPGQIPAVVRFGSGDSLHGRVESIDRDHLVRFLAPAVKEQLEFDTLEVASVHLQNREIALASPPQNYVVRFVNGDEIMGNIGVVDAETVVLDTWYAGRLTIPRSRVKSIGMVSSENVIYEGPTGLEGWVVSDSKQEEGEKSDSWRYRDGVFFGKEGGGIAREMNLPDMASLDLDVAWRDFLQLTVTVYTKSLQVYQLGRNVLQANGALVNQPVPDQPGPGFYAIQFNRNTLYLLTVREDGQVVNSPLDVVRELDLKNKARIGVRVNRPQKTISLLVDGKLVKTWKETGEFAGQGTAVRLVQQGQALINISNIRVTEWDGKLDVPDAVTENITSDLVHLRNQDTLSGKLVGITDGRLAFTTSFGTLDIPVERVAQIEMPVSGNAVEQLLPRSVRARLLGRGTLTFQLEEWAGPGVVGVSPNFGKATFNPAAFERVDFNIENPR